MQHSRRVSQFHIAGALPMFAQVVRHSADISTPVTEAASTAVAGMNIADSMIKRNLGI